MFCSQCGHSMPDTARFCPRCGQPVVRVEQQPAPPFDSAADAAVPQASNSAPEEGGTLPLLDHTSPDDAPPPPEEAAVVPPPQPPAPPVLPVQEPPRPPRKGRRVPVPLIAALAVILVAAGVFFGWRMIAGSNAYQQALDQGAQALEAGDYEAAAQAYEQALDARPEDPAAALGLSQAYLCLGEMDQARQLLSGLTLDQGSESYDRLQHLLALSQYTPEIQQVDTSAFPVVTVQIPCPAGMELTAEQVSVTEDGQARPIQSVQVQEDGTALISYTSQDTDVSDEARNFSLSFTLEQVPFRQAADYTTPHFDPATVSLVSTDVSQYPVVRAYFRVEDTQSGDNVSGLTGSSFTIYERVEGGEYLAREIQSVTPLEGNAGLNIALVADKSDSISATDMGKIKTVMTEFVNHLHYDVGDKAEVLAFDTVVQQMCYYTDDPSLLINGINNMSTDGRTAFYDAVYDGITHAALQGGARCVIAFTDGIDNESRRSANEIVSYANQKQVPVYIIGVGDSVETSTLRSMAEGTGGRYWFIDDLYDLEAIFNQVYTEQKELYMVEYVSDSALDSYTARDITVSVSGGGHRGEDTISFTPVASINDAGGTAHDGRYQLVMGALSWEEASQRCQEMGGHLATITSQAEMDEIVAMAEAAGAEYIWLGGTTSYDDDGNVFGHWVTGEDFSFQAWAPGEPSRVDQDGTEEWYIMLWNIESLGGWTWNDQRNDPAAVVTAMRDKMAYVCEFES